MIVLLMAFVHDEGKKTVICLGLGLEKKNNYLKRNKKKPTIVISFLGLSLYLEHFRTWKSTHTSLTL